MSANEDLLAAGVPSSALAAVEHVIGCLAVELGESPEAWRGADRFAALVNGLLQVGVDDPGRVTDREASMNRTLTCLVLVLGVFRAHPLHGRPS